MERKGKKRRHGGRHRGCPRPNLFQPGESVEEETMEGELVEPLLQAEDGGGGAEGRVFPAVPMCVGERPADLVAAAWRGRERPAPGPAIEEAALTAVASQECPGRMMRIPDAAEARQGEGCSKA
ncbi:hypothetical protein CORC01_12543 [Colletotrichum orchidophilum]|uniref:Uncharacterized protein n=1 Tax=Colletotrichum orchidophilum TaxID=1209926 RepID=A0A1G4ASK4_9PEZI|nr:uncharacterized protein CORC01_12543 [Colletotrichum orchidophilum]OHE92140.1 hypothetical protein CORC01_12543 [Colletotrichum orchidophilum]